jgi:hypothetical protein
MRKLHFLFIFMVVGVMACASSRYEVVDLPLRDAGLYPRSHTYADLSVAIDDFANPDRSERYFGSDLIGNGILPVDVLVSNFSRHRWAVRPSDVLLRRGDSVIDPLPIGMVAELIQSEARYNKETRKMIENHIDSLMLKETVVFPRDRQHGVMFFPVLERREQNEFFSRVPLFAEGLKLQLVATNLDTGERRMFGPYSIFLGMRLW